MEVLALIIASWILTLILTVAGCLLVEHFVFTKKCDWCGKRSKHLKTHYVNCYKFGQYCSNSCREAAWEDYKDAVIPPYLRSR